MQAKHEPIFKFKVSISNETILFLCGA